LDYHTAHLQQPTDNSCCPIFAPMKWKRIRKWLLWIAVVYVAGGIALYFLQDYILFRPLSLKRDHKYNFAIPHKDIDIAIDHEDTLNLVQFLSTGTVTRGVVLYFHGNKKNISWYAKYPPYFTKHGYEVWMIDYPGYGKSLGDFDEQTLYDWSKLVYDFAKRRFPADSIIVYGKSMGTGIATNLASKEKCRRLILETPYYDFPSVVRQFLFIYPVDWIIHYKLRTYKYLKNVEVPVTIFHGTKDNVIFYRNAKRLQPILKSTDEFVTIEGGHHNDLFEFGKVTRKLDSLLNR
jgi:pimeloyl-ACP methyl ester carboxylesterase